MNEEYVYLPTEAMREGNFLYVPELMFFLKRAPTVSRVFQANAVCLLYTYLGFKKYFLYVLSNKMPLW